MHAESRRLIVFGGTFDPPHHAHVTLPTAVMHALEADGVLYVPAAVSPFKVDRPPSPASHRVAMLEAALTGQPGFRLDARELERGGPSYTVDTLDSLRRENPARTLLLIMGMDAFLGLPAWYRWRQILDLCHVVVAQRPGSAPPDTGILGDLLSGCRAWDAADLSAPAGRIVVMPVTALDISATKIRADVGGGGDPRFLVTDPVRQLILASGCYRHGASPGD